MKIYTRRGDGGRTQLIGAVDVDKDDIRVEAYGAVDELNAALGVAVASGSLRESLSRTLHRVQHELFSLGAELADGRPDRASPTPVRGEMIAALEAEIDAMETELPPLREFILPGGSPAGAALHFARTVCRRAERRVVTLKRQQAAPGSGDSMEDSAAPRTATAAALSLPIQYLNRLADLLFVAARLAALDSGAEELKWRKPQ